MKPFVNKYKWEEINFPLQKDDWKRFEKNNVTISLNVFNTKKEKIYPAFVSKHNSNRAKPVTILMISNRDKWHYLAVKKLSTLLRELTSKHHGGFYCLNCLPSFATETKVESHKNVWENKYFCNVIMCSEETKILEFSQYQKSDKAPFVIYTDLECTIAKIDICKNNPENSSTTKISKHIPSGFSKFTMSLFRNIENKYDLYRGKSCIKNFCELLREHAIKITN